MLLRFEFPILEKKAGFSRFSNSEAFCRTRRAKSLGFNPSFSISLATNSAIISVSICSFEQNHTEQTSPSIVPVPCDSIDTITLLENTPSEKDTDGGSTTLRWWTWTVRIRTVAKVPIQVNLLDSFREPIYQKIAKKSLQFHELGFSYCKIAKLLDVDEKTVAKAINWIAE